MSRASPATRAHIQPLGFGEVRIPTPLTISRSPYARSIFSCPRMPKDFASVPGASTSTAPSARLNHPSPRASASPFPFLSMVPPLVARMGDDLDAAVFLVAERLVHARDLVERHAMGDDERRVDLVLLDAAQEVVRPAVHVGLAGAHGEPLVHQLPDGDLVVEAAVHARDRQ